jgi:hypothetical protein
MCWTKEDKIKTKSVPHKWLDVGHLKVSVTKYVGEAWTVWLIIARQTNNIVVTINIKNVS